MEKILTTAAIFTLLFNTMLHAQNLPWLEVGSEWTYQHGYYSGPEQFQLKFGITEETLYLGKPCVKMDHLSGWGYGCMGMQPPFYFYVSNDSLYFSTNDLDEFRLAAYFGAQPGDSWVFTINGNNFNDSFLVQVNDVTTVVLGGYSLRQLNVTYTYMGDPEEMYNYITPESMEITEVIGAHHMFFVPMGHGMLCHITNVRLQCFESLSFSYLSPEFPSCDHIVGIEENDPFSSPKVFPNPARGGVQIEIPDIWQHHIGNLQLLSSTGKVVYDQTAVLSSLMRIPLDGLTQGMYFVIINVGQERGSAKLIVE